ncbi:hypothetical protein [Tenacibaculum sp. Bg11-29]|uniref:hypothetical protein n=1 Tax=Tenacibaculum sp. Bg11-29 TaxID=2058306 RepID=UPI0012FF2B69|nr:hypothetical protein [Tenacibaculum sp. Bg11-29]
MAGKIQKDQVRNKIAPFIVAIICITSLYSFEFLPSFSDGYSSALNEYKIAEKINKSALSEIKENAKGTSSGDKYVETFAVSLEKWKKFKVAKNEEAVFGFKSLQLFIAELGPMLCFFIYILYMIFRSFYFDRKNVGVKVLHGLILTGPIFYFYWIFQPFQDVSRVTYYFMTFVSAIVVVFAVFLITKYQDHRINRLKKGQFELAKFTFKNTKAEKREEMLTTIERIVKDN